MDLKNYIASETNCKLYLAEAKQISTFKGGGKAYVFIPESVEKLIEIVRVLSDENMRIFMLGKGSNTLISDGICESILISTKALNSVKTDGEFAFCECGAPMNDVISEGRKHGLGGLEFLSGVPCSIGGAVKMNAGAFGAQICDYIHKIRVLNLDCVNKSKIVVQEINAEDLRFSYRRGVDGIVLDAELKLDEKSAEKSINDAKRYISFRRKKQPNLPSLGSVFKNGSEASGKLIENCALKGEKRGGARISEKHANFIVNEGGASAEDYLYLVELCKKRVYENAGVLLEEEFVLIK